MSHTVRGIGADNNNVLIVYSIKEDRVRNGDQLLNNLPL